MVFSLLVEAITGLTVEHYANLGERLEPHACDVAAFQQRYIDLGDSHLFGESFEAHFAFGEHDAEIHNDGHV